MIKKTIALLLALCLALSLAACGGGDHTEPTVNPDDEVPSGSSGNFDLPDICFFDASLLDGTAVSADELFDGKDVTIVNCWATWCGPCLEEMDAVAAFAKTLPDNVQLVTFCVDGTQHTEDCAQILEDAGFEGPALIDADGDFKALLTRMQYVPTTLFVDKMGHLVCDSLIGAPSDLPSAYKERINIGLKAAGKDELQ